MIKRTDITKCRMELLKQFDYYVRNIIGDDEITEEFMMMGLPDDYDETDLKEIALDDNLWLNCVDCFLWCCTSAGVM